MLNCYFPSQFYARLPASVKEVSSIIYSVFLAQDRESFFQDSDPPESNAGVNQFLLNFWNCSNQSLINLVITIWVDSK